MKHHKTQMDVYKRASKNLRLDILIRSLPDSNVEKAIELLTSLTTPDKIKKQERISRIGTDNEWSRRRNETS